MIGYLKGKVLYTTAEAAIIDVNGVGYEVICSRSAFSKLAEGAVGEVYTYLQISEQNGATLYGFSSTEEKAMFLKLITVPNVGPKVGICVLSGMDIGNLAAAIATGDVKTLSSIKGLGKKTAEKIILELREKVTAPVAGSSKGTPLVAPVTDDDDDTVVALMTLGFSREESKKAVARAKAQGAQGIEEIIRAALKGM